MWLPNVLTTPSVASACIVEDACVGPVDALTVCRTRCLRTLASMWILSLAAARATSPVNVTPAARHANSERVMALLMAFLSLPLSSEIALDQIRDLADGVDVVARPIVERAVDEGGVHIRRQEHPCARLGDDLSPRLLERRLDVLVVGLLHLFEVRLDVHLVRDAEDHGVDGVGRLVRHELLEGVSAGRLGLDYFDRDIGATLAFDARLDASEEAITG